jgi:glutamine cyclotransferase
MSSYSVRHFIIDKNDQIFKISQAKFDRMLTHNSEEKIPSFAGLRLRYAEIAIELRNRKPDSVVRSIFSYLSIDSDGFLDFNRYLKDGGIVSSAGLPDFGKMSGSNLIDANKIFSKKLRNNTVWWIPKQEIEKAIYDASLGFIKIKSI